MDVNPNAPTMAQWKVVSVCRLSTRRFDIANIFLFVAYSTPFTMVCRGKCHVLEPNPNFRT